MNYKDFDIIVIGSGLAATAFAQSCVNKKVLLIEGGHESLTDKNNQLTLNNEYGHFENYWSNHWLRCLGGTSRVWNGYLATLDKRDFLGSQVLPSWPIKYEDLHSYYLKAAVFLSRTENIILRNSDLLFDNSLVFKPFSNGTPKRITTENDICISKNIQLVKNLHLIKLISVDRKKIDNLLVSDSTGKVHFIQIQANQKIVLACGGLGNAQILLQPHQDSKTSVGNESGLVGKYLMEHPHTNCGEAYFKDSFFASLNQTMIKNNFGVGTMAFTLTDASYYKENLLACTIGLSKINFEPDNFNQYWAKKFNSKLTKIVLYARSEQQPQVSNKVSLTNEKNSVGLYKLKTEVFFSSLDLSSIYQTTRKVAEVLLTQKVGVVKIDNESIARKTTGGGHTMGTTKMGLNIKDSVVDKNCKVHGYSNLYIAGSSVFTTAGASNPTLTIVALSMRLAHHLSSLP